MQREGAPIHTAAQTFTADTITAKGYTAFAATALGITDTAAAAEATHVATTTTVTTPVATAAAATEGLPDPSRRVMEREGQGRATREGHTDAKGETQIQGTRSQDI